MPSPHRQFWVWMFVVWALGSWAISRVTGAFLDGWFEFLALVILGTWWGTYLGRYATKWIRMTKGEI